MARGPPYSHVPTGYRGGSPMRSGLVFTLASATTLLVAGIPGPSTCGHRLPRRGVRPATIGPGSFLSLGPLQIPAVGIPIGSYAFPGGPTAYVGDTSHIQQRPSDITVTTGVTTDTGPLPDLIVQMRSTRPGGLRPPGWFGHRLSLRLLLDRPRPSVDDGTDVDAQRRRHGRGDRPDVHRLFRFQGPGPERARGGCADPLHGQRHLVGRASARSPALSIPGSPPATSSSTS